MIPSGAGFARFTATLSTVDATSDKSNSSRAYAGVHASSAQMSRRRGGADHLEGVDVEHEVAVRQDDPALPLRRRRVVAPVELPRSVAVDESGIQVDPARPGDIDRHAQSVAAIRQESG